jgi:predicted metal-dependent phosphoesterase TrpH
MKIDLHLHTQKIKKSESEDRDITPERFKNELINANVGIAAITNHHFFDENQYKKMIDNENYILLPGVELDVSIKEKDYEKTIHANVIAHPKNIKILKEILDRIKNNQNPIKYEDFCNEFNKEK